VTLDGARNRKPQSAKKKNGFNYLYISLLIKKCFQCSQVFLYSLYLAWDWPKSIWFIDRLKFEDFFAVLNFGFGSQKLEFHRDEFLGFDVL
jgi:hypothetical protein